MLDQNTDRMWYVIGAVLIGAAIIFGMNTLIPNAFASVGGMMEDITDDIGMFMQVMSSKDTIVLHSMDLSNGINRSVLCARTNTYIDINDSLKSPTGSEVLDISFTESHTGTRSGVNDLVVWFDLSNTNAIREGDTLEITFYAKSSEDVIVASRFGGAFDSDFIKANISEDWDFYRFRVPVRSYAQYADRNDVKGAFVMWSENPSEVSISDLNIQVYVSEDDD